MRISSSFRLFSLLILAFILSSCSWLFGDPDPIFDFPLTEAPRLSPSHDVDLVVSEPKSSGALEGNSILLRLSDGQTLLYHGSGVLSDRLPKRVAYSLLEAFVDSGGFSSVFGSAVNSRFDFRLASDILRFEMVEQSSGAFVAVVRIKFDLIDQRDSRVVESRLFSSQVDASGGDIIAMVAALGAALDEVREKAVRWVHSQIGVRFVNEIPKARE